MDLRRVLDLPEEADAGSMSTINSAKRESPCMDTTGKSVRKKS